MSDLIDRKIAVEGVQELFSMGDCYCDKLSIIGMLNSLPSAESEERTVKVSNQIFNNSNPYIIGAWIGTCECGELVSYSSKYCHMCGARLEWT